MKLLTIIQNFFLNHSQFKKENKKFLTLDMTALNKELNEKLPLYIPSQSKIESHASKEGGGLTINEDLTLEDIFESKEKYDLIFDILAEEGLCGKETHIWIDYRRGYKSVIIALLKTLQIQGYYIHSHHLSHDEIMIIVKNTFNIKISIDLIKHISPLDIDINYIPFASEIDQLPKLPKLPKKHSLPPLH